MKEPLYFHILPKTYSIQVNYPDGSSETTMMTDPFRPHTYSVTNEDKTFFVGYSVVHKRDQFNKERGRTISKSRMSAATTYAHRPMLDLGYRIHDDIKLSLEAVVRRAAQIRKVDGPFNVIVNCDDHGKRVFTQLQID
jgi:hypothetical protein